MKTLNYRRTRFACFYAYLSMASAFVLPPMLFVTFNEMYGISYTLLGTLVLVNFCTQMIIDLIFTFFTKYFNIPLTIRTMPFLTTAGFLIYALVPFFFPQYAFAGLAAGTVVFSVAAGLSEVLLSPIVAAIPSEHPDKDMSLLHSLYGWGVVSSVLIASAFFLIFGTENWTYLVLAISVLPLIASILFFTSPIPDADVNSGERKKSGKGIFFCVLCIFFGSAAENSMTNWISSYMENALQLPKALGDILGLAVFALLLAITRVLYAKFTPDITKTLIVSMAGCAVCYIVTGVSPSVILSFITCIFVGLFSAMLWPGTLIFMEEKMPSPGIAAYALMAASGDMGASVAPQLLGIVVDKVSESRFAIDMSLSTGATPDEIGLKAAMLVGAAFPTIGIFIVLIGSKKLFKKVKDK